MVAPSNKPGRSAGSRTNGTVLDLFSGCGGLSLGFRSAGFDVLGGVELDSKAAQTHGNNFHPGCAAHAIPRDVSTKPADLLKQLGLKATTAIDILVGGPPCQAFARVGRAKLRSESARLSGPGDERAWLDDPRVGLYARYLAYVDALRPKALLMENVPDVLNHGGENIAEGVCIELEAHGYDVAYTLLNAAHFGVPQMRERMFLIAIRRDVPHSTITFPAPTHHHDLPRGYQGTRACALRPLKAISSRATHYLPLKEADSNLPAATTAEQALSDLPPLHAMQLVKDGLLRRGPRRLDQTAPYTGSPTSAYATLMRQWPQFRSESATAHVIRYLPRDYPIFRSMKPGDQYPAAVAIANRRLRRKLARMRTKPGPNSAAFQQLMAAFVPPYDPKKFPNKWRKMEPDAPARTLMAHLGKDSYSHIHYSDAQARTISVREAARLQSFPDGFEICGSMNHGFRQIGNAVPPLIAYALARHMRSLIHLDKRSDFRVSLGFIAAPRRRRRSTAAATTAS